MDKQMNGLHPYFQRWLILLPMVLVILACNFTVGPGAQTTPVPQGSTGKTPQISALPQGSNGETPQTAPAGLDPLERLLEMRSIHFNLTALQPNGTERSVPGEIDSSGNMHLKLHDSVSLPPDMAEKFSTTLKGPEDSELYVVDGKTYQPDAQNPAWMTTPVAEDYGVVLSNQLHGPDGPGLWLDLLPAGSLQPAGGESVGGFAADKYTVNGMVHGQKITGSLWYYAHALVQVELHIPAGLLDPTKPAAQGELKITLETQKADVPPVTLPSPPAGTAVPTAGS
jgi:hypothetical protein